MKSPDKFTEFCASFDQFGLAVLGALELQALHCPVDRQDFTGKPALLIGNQGPVMWEVLTASEEFADNLADPMNRWTKRILDKLAVDASCDVFFPFDEPYWPFQRIAQSAMNVKPSPLGILIHSEFGLWHAMRGVLIFEKSHEFASHISVLASAADNLIHPCDSCEDKPCLTTCPVGAFTGEELKVQSCFGHLDSGTLPNCMDLGCRARNACPVGNDHRYHTDQVRFHMKSYRGPVGR
ncbi:MAG: hypothetical protein AAGA76_02250 [Pseudomonadota bacterium]